MKTTLKPNFLAAALFAGSLALPAFAQTPQSITTPDKV